MHQLLHLSLLWCIIIFCGGPLAWTWLWTCQNFLVQSSAVDGRSKLSVLSDVWLQAMLNAETCLGLTCLLVLHRLAASDILSPTIAYSTDWDNSFSGGNLTLFSPQQSTSPLNVSGNAVVHSLDCLLMPPPDNCKYTGSRIRCLVSVFQISVHVAFFLQSLVAENTRHV